MATSALLNRSRVVQACSLLPLLGYVILWGDATQDFIKNVLSFNVALGNSWHLPWTIKLHLLYLGSALMLLGLIIYYLRCPRLLRKFADEYDYWQYAISIKSPQILVECLRGAVRRIEMNTVRVMDPALFEEVKLFIHEMMKKMKFSPGYEALKNASGFDRSALDLARKLLIDNASVAYNDGPIRAPLTQLLLAQFKFEQRNRYWSAFTSNVLGYLGAFLFFIPSAETFARVVLLYLKDLFAFL